MRLKNSIEEVYKFVMDALGSEGVVRKVKTVETHIEKSSSSI
jgi:hypothetical protein